MELLPIIFIHRGHSDYLRYTIDCARLHNPDAPFYLIGDETTKYLEHLGITHVLFSELGDWEEFNSVFRYIVSKSYKQDQEWVKFVYKRWFYLNVLVSKIGAKRFWTFDSDTLIMCNLAHQVHKYCAFDFTTQAHGHQINGFVTNTAALDSYLKGTVAMFKDDDFINKISSQILEAESGSLSDMAAFDYAKERGFFEKYKSIRLATIIDDETFDDALCHDDMGFEQNEVGSKRLYVLRDSYFFRHHSTNKMIRVNTINMSWVRTFHVAETFFARLQLLRIPLAEDIYLISDVPKA